MNQCLNVTKSKATITQFMKGHFSNDHSGTLPYNKISWVKDLVALYVTEGLECVELVVGKGAVESLWIRIKGQKK